MTTSRICTLCAVLALLPAHLYALSSQELIRVTFVNETGYSIKYLFASSSNSAIWGPDLLGPRKFDFGDILTYYVHYRGDCERFDFLALDEGGHAYLIQGFKTCDEDPLVQILVSNSIGSYRGLDITRVHITNATNRSIAYLFFAPKESSEWGFDILNDNTTLEPGDTISFSVPVGTKEQHFEMLAIGKDQTLVQKQLALQNSKTDIFIDITFSDLH